VRPLRHERVERPDTTPREKLVSDRKENMSVIVTRPIGNDREHTLTGLDAGERLVNDFGQ